MAKKLIRVRGQILDTYNQLIQDRCFLLNGVYPIRTNGNGEYRIILFQDDLTKIQNHIRGTDYLNYELETPQEDDTVMHLRFIREGEFEYLQDKDLPSYFSPIDFLDSGDGDLIYVVCNPDITINSQIGLYSIKEGLYKSFLSYDLPINRTEYIKKRAKSYIEGRNQIYVGDYTLIVCYGAGDYVSYLLPYMFERYLGNLWVECLEKGQRYLCHLKEGQNPDIYKIPIQSFCFNIDTSPDVAYYLSEGRYYSTKDGYVADCTYTGIFYNYKNIFFSEQGCHIFNKETQKDENYLRSESPLYFLKGSTRTPLYIGYDSQGLVSARYVREEMVYQISLSVSKSDVAEIEIKGNIISILKKDGEGLWKVLNLSDNTIKRQVSKSNLSSPIQIINEYSYAIEYEDHYTIDTLDDSMQVITRRLEPNHSVKYQPLIYPQDRSYFYSFQKEGITKYEIAKDEMEVYMKRPEAISRDSAYWHDVIWQSPKLQNMLLKGYLSTVVNYGAYNQYMFEVGNHATEGYSVIIYNTKAKSTYRVHKSMIGATSGVYLQLIYIWQQGDNQYALFYTQPNRQKFQYKIVDIVNQTLAYTSDIIELKDISPIHNISLSADAYKDKDFSFYISYAIGTSVSLFRLYKNTEEKIIVQKLEGVAFNKIDCNTIAKIGGQLYVNGGFYDFNAKRHIAIAEGVVTYKSNLIDPDFIINEKFSYDSTADRMNYLPYFMLAKDAPHVEIMLNNSDIGEYSRTPTGQFLPKKRLREMLSSYRYNVVVETGEVPTLIEWNIEGKVWLIPSDTRFSLPNADHVEIVSIQNIEGNQYVYSMPTLKFYTDRLNRVLIQLGSLK